MNEVEVLSNSVSNLFLLCKVFVRKFGALTLSRKEKEKKNVMAMTVSKCGAQSWAPRFPWGKKKTYYREYNVILCSS